MVGESTDPILIVDDAKSIRDLVAFTLDEAGFAVQTAEDGMEALDFAKDNTVRAIITDVNMPNLDGLSFIIELRKLERHKYTPVLVLTTEAGVGKKLVGKSIGATGWIVKPFQPDALLKTVRRVI